MEHNMIQCKECEHFRQGADGEIGFRCDPFSNIKEPECLAKWQLLKINQMVAAYQATLEYYRKLGPMQEKMLKVVQHELDEMNEGEKWKVNDDEETFESPGEEDEEKEKP
jgi:hypothetical protein